MTGHQLGRPLSLSHQLKAASPLAAPRTALFDRRPVGAPALVQATPPALKEPRCVQWRLNPFFDFLSLSVRSLCCSSSPTLFFSSPLLWLSHFTPLCFSTSFLPVFSPASVHCPVFQLLSVCPSQCLHLGKLTGVFFFFFFLSLAERQKGFF